jgi:DNA-directed RNA polymerase specialized sigma24 family protein
MVAKKTTPRIERLIVDNYRGGLTIREIASVISLSFDTVRQVLKRAGVERRAAKQPYAHSQHDDQIKRLYLDNYSTRDIARKLNLTQATVHRYLKRMKVPLRDRVEAIIISHQ